MCGRFSLIKTPEALGEAFGFDNLPNLAPRFNIAPTQDIAVVRKAAGGGRELVAMRWGLVPSWSKDGPGAAPLINARAETVAAKPSFRAAFAKRRCLIPADGFYEWRSEDGHKQPFRIGFADGRGFAMAGLWEHWTAPDGEGAGELQSVAVITTGANRKLRPIHPRMPAILDPADYGPWLDEGADPAALEALLGPHDAGDMAFYRVGLRVNSVANDDADCIAPLEH